MPRHLELSISGILKGSLSVSCPDPISEYFLDRGATVIHNAGRFRTRFNEVSNCIQDITDLLYEACQKRYDRVLVSLDNDQYKDAIVHKLDLLQRLPGIRIKLLHNRNNDVIQATYHSYLKRLVYFGSNPTSLTAIEQDLFVMTDEEIDDLIDDACSQASDGQTTPKFVSMHFVEAAIHGINIPSWVAPFVDEEISQKEKPDVDISIEPWMEELSKIFKPFKSNTSIKRKRSQKKQR